MNMDNALAPTGKFRVGMNGNNATLVRRGADGTVSGLSADLGRFIAGRLGVPFEAVVYESSTPFTASFRQSEWDIVLTGKNAVVAELLDFSADLFLTEYGYVAAPGQDFANPAAVDRAGVRIAVPRRASADVFLSRTLKHAELVRVDGNLAASIEFLRAGQAEVFASSMDSAREIAAHLPGATVVGAFNTVTFSVALPKGRPPAALARLNQLVSEAKAAGVVRKALAHAKDVQVLP
jgi:polar amino acid transport system substrate-binding protein